MKVLVTYQGEYGKRIASFLKTHSPSNWEVFDHQLPKNLPSFIDEPVDFLPANFPEADLLIAIGESPGASDLIQDIAKMAKAKAVISPISNREWMPTGLKNQIERTLAKNGIASVFPVPFCELDDDSNEFIGEFAKHFGKTSFKNVTVEDGKIKTCEAGRCSPCGNTLFVAEKLIGTKAEEAEYKTGMLHHNYPCLSTMGLDAQFDDTLMHRSGLFFKIAISKELEPYKKQFVTYVNPKD